MQEAERFVAAAIAFAWAHDSLFRNHFWNCICCFDGDPEICEKTEILVEPYRWSDLLIINPVKPAPFIYAVELKIRAGLEDIQDPTELEFDRPGGYGEMFRSSFSPSANSLQFVLLGAKELDLSIRRSLSSPRIKQRTWKNLADCFPTSSIANDLKYLLGMFGIGAFPAADVQNMKIDTQSNEFAKAAKIIPEVKRRLAWPYRFREQPSIGYATGNWFLGIELLTADSGPAKLLKHLVNPPGRHLAWFGYQGEEGGTPSLGVWLYCGSGEIRENISKKLRGELKECSIDDTQLPEDKAWYLIITARRHSWNNDCEWFCDVFNKFGLNISK